MPTLAFYRARAQRMRYICARWCLSRAQMRCCTPLLSGKPSRFTTLAVMLVRFKITSFFAPHVYIFCSLRYEEAHSQHGSNGSVIYQAESSGWSVPGWTGFTTHFSGHLTEFWFLVHWALLKNPCVHTTPCVHIDPPDFPITRNNTGNMRAKR